MHRTLRHIVAAAVTFAGIVACSDADSSPSESVGPNTEPKLVVTLSTHLDTVPEITSKPIEARVTDQSGLLKSAPVTWSSTDPAVASVNAGMITGVAPGTAMIIAAAGTDADTARIVVTPNELTLDVQPSAAAIAMGDTIDFVATLRTRSGDIVSVNHYSWTSSDTAAAQFINAGSLKAKSVGDVSVSAEALQRKGWSSVKVFRSPVASVTISPTSASINKGGTIDLEVTLRDQYGRLVEDSVTWGSSDFTRATVTQAGLVTGVGVGSVVITATAGSKTGSATINVLSPSASSVSLVFNPDTVLVGLEVQATATPLDASGDPLSGRTIAYQSANPSVATVTSTGRVKGIAEGSTNISAIVDGVVSSKKMNVRARTATRIAIVPASPSVTAGQQSQLVARVYDQTDTEITGLPIFWSSSDQGVAMVSSSGVLSGVAAGSASIGASSGSLSASAPATVTNVPVASAQVSPPSLSLVAGGTGSLSALAYDANQAVLTGRVTSWSSQNTSVATVTSAGYVTAVAPGTTTVVATIEGKTASATITVSAPPPAIVASVSVSLVSSSLSVGQQTQATAVVRDAQGNTLTGRTITWFSLDTAVAKVSASGVVTAYAGGTVAIMARADNVSGSASLSVIAPAPAPVALVQINTPTQDIVVGQSVQTVVVLKDAQGNVLTGRTITYSTDNPAVISVSSSGVVTGVGAGTTRMRATSGGVSNTETFRVTVPSTPAPAPTVETITVSPATASLTVGQTSQETAVARDASGTTVSGQTFTWTTSNAAVASVNGSGLVTANGAGSATISAASSGKVGTMSVSVTQPSSPPAPATVASVTVSLSASSILVGGTSQASAVARDAQGNVITGRPVTWSGGGLLATISSSGLVTGLLLGVVPVTATIDGVNGSASLTITSPLSPPTASATVELPRTFLNYTYPAKTGQTIVVPAGGNLQTALNNAQRGDEIVLTAGATYTGNFVLPAKSGTAANGWIVIRSDLSNQLPPIGTRVTSAQAGLMAKIITPNTTAALKTAAAASGWWLSGLEVSVSSAVTTQQWGLIFLGESGAAQTTLSVVPTDLVLDRMYIHGQTTTNMSRCIALNSARTQITDSYIMECHGKGFDSQAILGWNGPGPYKIVNNTLQGAGENVMFGGADPTIPNLVPSDIEIRRNYIYTPVAWKGVWTKKNLLELKNASRVLIAENVLEGSWIDGQTGWAILLRSTNQDGTCRWCRSTDVTLRRNYITNVAGGVNFIGSGGNSATDTTARRMYVSETVIDNIGIAPYTGEQRGFLFVGGPEDITLERTVAVGNLNLLAWMDKSYPAKRVTFKDNIWSKGLYGMSADGTTQGTPSLDVAIVGYSWSNMTLIGGSVSTYPTGTSFVTAESQVSLAAQIRATVQSAVAGVVIP